MQKFIALCLIVLFWASECLFAQDSLSNGKALNFPLKKYGISFGNSREFTGIRLNFADADVRKVNGLNVTLWTKKWDKTTDKVVNGISAGTLVQAASLQFINLGLLGVGTSSGNINGLNIGGFVVGSAGNVRGLTVGGLLVMADGRQSVLSGIALAALGVGAEKAINGFAFGGLGAGTPGDFNGIASSLAYVQAGRNFRGLSVTAGYQQSGTFMGVSVAGYADARQMYGLSLALFNRTQELHGVQVGLLNYAGNNPRGLRLLPCLNAHW